MRRSLCVLSLIAFAQLALACHGSLYALSQRHYQRLCTDPQFAFESGFNSGLQRKPLDTSWATEKCAPQRVKDARDRYVAGYREGIENAPAAVPLSVQVPARGGYAPAASSCTFSSDCGRGRSCRSWGGGDRVCMGHGGLGDPCVFNSDCLSDSCRIREAGELEKVCR